MKKDGDHTYTLSLTVRNRPGVLVRCAQVFNRRGHNIEALNVSAATENRMSVMLITAFGKQESMQQVMSQLNKLIDVVCVAECGNPKILSDSAQSHIPQKAQRINQENK